MIIVLVISLLINGALILLCILMGKTILIQNKQIEEASKITKQIEEASKITKQILEGRIYE